MRGVWAVAVLLSGCSLFDPLDVVYQSQLDAGDLGVDVAVDAPVDALITDATSDATIDSAVDMPVDAPVDSPPDAVADMTQDTADMATCLSELPRTEFVFGRACQNSPIKTETGICDVIEQTGCGVGEYCDLLPVSQTAFKAVCRNGLDITNGSCEFLAYDAACTSRPTADVPPETLGTCYPGSLCKGVRTGELSSPCVRLCDLDTARGCEDEYCVPFANQYSVFGVGRCEATNANCP